MTETPQHPPTTAVETRPLPLRLVDVIVSPGSLTTFLASNPLWVGAMVVAVGLIALQFALIPAEVFAGVQREAALRAGREVPEMSARALAVMQWVTPIFAAISTAVMAAVFAGLYTFIFAFILGDEGEFRQYLAVVSHAWFIPALVGLFLTPLRISTGDPQFSLNLASFAFFVPEGYILNVLRVLDLTQIWATLIVAQGAHAIDRRRTFTSAAAILLGLTFVVALVLGRFIPN